MNFLEAKHLRAKLLAEKRSVPPAHPCSRFLKVRQFESCDCFVIVVIIDSGCMRVKHARQRLQQFSFFVVTLLFSLHHSVCWATPSTVLSFGVVRAGLRVSRNHKFESVRWCRASQKTLQQSFIWADQDMRMRIPHANIIWILPHSDTSL